MPRFVILEHDHPTLHWDLMLEVGAVLRTWRLARPPELADEIIEATLLGDHRVFYLDYEGPVSGGRGTVRYWDRGEYEGPLDPDLDTVEVRFVGQKLRGSARLFKDGSNWRFTIT